MDCVEERNGYERLRAANEAWLLQRTASWEAVCITFICLLDLLTTLYWVSQGTAREGNPVMAVFLEMGTVPFILVKVLTFVPAVLVAEWYRPRRPELITRVMRWTIVGYLVLYVAGVAAHYGRVGEFYRNLLLG